MLTVVLTLLIVIAIVPFAQAAFSDDVLSFYEFENDCNDTMGVHNLSCTGIDFIAHDGQYAAQAIDEDDDIRCDSVDTRTGNNAHFTICGSFNQSDYLNSEYNRIYTGGSYVELMYDKISFYVGGSPSGVVRYALNSSERTEIESGFHTICGVFNGSVSTANLRGSIWLDGEKLIPSFKTNFPSRSGVMDEESDVCTMHEAYSDTPSGHDTIIIYNASMNAEMIGCINETSTLESIETCVNPPPCTEDWEPIITELNACQANNTYLQQTTYQDINECGTFINFSTLDPVNGTVETLFCDYCVEQWSGVTENLTTCRSNSTYLTILTYEDLNACDPVNMTFFPGDNGTVDSLACVYLGDGGMTPLQSMEFKVSAVIFIGILALAFILSGGNKIFKGAAR